MTTDDKSPSAEAAELRSRLEALEASDPAPRMAAAQRQVAESVSTTAANLSQTVSQTASDVRDTVAQKAADVVDAVAPPLRQGVERVRGAVNSARNAAAQVREGKESLSERVRDQPFLTVGLAALTGYVLGRAVR